MINYSGHSLNHCLLLQKLQANIFYLLSLTFGENLSKTYVIACEQISIRMFIMNNIMTKVCVLSEWAYMRWIYNEYWISNGSEIYPTYIQRVLTFPLRTFVEKKSEKICNNTILDNPKQYWDYIKSEWIFQVN